MLCLAVAGCSAGADDEESIGDESAALTGPSLTAGAQALTTSKLRLREEPSTSARVLTVLDFHAALTIVDGPDNGFYQVKTADGQEGYCHGAYLRPASGNANTGGGGNQQQQSGAFPTENVFRSRGTGYYPANNAMEGGFNDRRGARLRTLQQYLNGSAEYVSVAMDSNAFNYGQKLRIKELEQKYGRQIEFRVVDTGGAFQGRGRSRIDICTASSSASVDPTINGMLTIAVVR